ncbi:glutamate-5-semialdehyde dehydrogenase [Facilibium subflavum]|uniref:glutamate-5-semialdehyde dehydrogenase n=1 Tax=Facilibium subflavum TaxID=2219058 RepID=UPI001F21589A|nr:glutamate-5-semialdehyde dehydrogenase [Facilibium subflavum]
MKTVQEKIQQQCRLVKENAKYFAVSTDDVRNKVLKAMAEALLRHKKAILYANHEDIKNAHKKGLSLAMIDRLSLDEIGIEKMAAGLIEISKQPDPLNKILSHTTRPSGLDIKAISVPLGVIAVIYESRPNVTVDAAGLCLKSGNGVLLRGGSECLHSNRAIMAALHEGLLAAGMPTEAIEMVAVQERQAIDYLVQQDRYIDVIVPRGGKALIEHLTKHSKIPLFKHLDGICHSYIHQDADIDKAVDVCVNAKMRRVSICGATETILIDKKIINIHLPKLLAALQAQGCALYLDSFLYQIFSEDFTCEKACEQDWSTEYLDAIVSIKSVNGIQEAIDHINKYGSHHTDAIITEDQSAAELFFQEIDSAVVMHNTSTQFSDGGEFGMGAEIGISTGKLHARGPVGVQQLTTFKYCVTSDGSTRN